MKRTVAEIVRFAAIVGEVIHRTVRRDEFRVLGYELCKKPKKSCEGNERLGRRKLDERTADGGPECLDRARELVHRNRES